MVPIPKALIGQSSRAGPGPQFGPEPCLVTGESLESHGREREPGYYSQRLQVQGRGLKKHTTGLKIHTTGLKKHTTVFNFLR